MHAFTIKELSSELTNRRTSLKVASSLETFHRRKQSNVRNVFNYRAKCTLYTGRGVKVKD